MLSSDPALQIEFGQYSILAPVLLLIVVELSQLARDIDLIKAVEVDHDPLILDAIAAPFTALYDLFIPDVLNKGIKENYSIIPYITENRIEKVWKLAYPRLGSFTIIHTANVSILLLGMYVTRGTAPIYGVSSGPVIFFLATVLLPIFEVDEYDLISASSDSDDSLFVYIYINVLFFSGLLASSEEPNFGFYTGWFTLISYLYLVVLAKDIRGIRDIKSTTNTASD